MTVNTVLGWSWAPNRTRALTHQTLQGPKSLLSSATMGLTWESRGRPKCSAKDLPVLVHGLCTLSPGLGQGVREQVSSTSAEKSEISPSRCLLTHGSCLTPLSLQDGQSRTIRQFQFTDWPEQGVPKTGEGFIDFIGQVHKTKEQFGQDGPITVHCR